MEAAPFCGREEELAALISEWEAMTAGGGPRVVAILGEMGLGKTRLAQAFFGRISARSGDGYWPPILETLGNNLQVNPAPDAARTGPPPFLWWGLRFVDPLKVNSVGTGVLPAGVENNLLPQIEPFRRTRRRQERRREAWSVGKDVALDLAIDLIPFGGLAKTVGEAGMELHRIYREDRDDGRGPARGETLIGGVLEDLALALAPAEGPARPAVILFDDGQFSTHDPGMTAFAAALLERGAAEGWPLLLLVTHWEREWDSASPGAIAAELNRAGRPPVRTLRLQPVRDLGPMLDAGLPGLTEAQRHALLDRVDGNPRFLGEVMLFATASEALFQGRDTAGPLTDRGLSRLLAKSTNMHELTRSRLRESPDEVREAVCLAALQGVEFLQSILGQTASGLAVDPDTLTAAVGAAERPHAYVRGIDPGIAAFAQRIYFEVAAEQLENCFDPDEAREALEAGVREVARSDRFDALNPAEQRRFLALASGLFEGAEEVADRMIAASCLYLLAQIANRENDIHTYRQIAGRLDTLIQRSGDQVLDGDLNWLRMIYDAAHGPEALQTEGRVVEQMFRLTREAAEEDANGWTIWMHVRSLALLADHHLNCGLAQPALDAATAAIDILSGWTLPDRTAEELLAWIEVYGSIARVMTAFGLSEKAVEFHEGQVAVAERMLELAPGNAEMEQIRAFASERAGRLAWMAGQPERAAVHLSASVDLYRQFAAEGVVSLELPAALGNLATARAQTHPGEAEALRQEALSHARGLLEASDVDDHRHILAWLLSQDAHALADEAPDRAYELAVEAAALCVRDGQSIEVSPDQLAQIHLLAAALAVRLRQAEAALPQALRARDLSWQYLSQQPSPAAQQRYLEVLIQLVEIEQSLGEVGNAALSLAEAERVLAGFQNEARSAVAALAERLVSAAAAQPRLH